MSRYASGKYSLRISDRSGAAFPYKEMVKEWNGSIVHTSEFEPKHPQLEQTKKQLADPEALRISRGQIADATAFPPTDGINFSSFQSEGMQPAPISKDTIVSMALGALGVRDYVATGFAMTVAPKGGGASGNAYYVDGVQQRSLNIIEGNLHLYQFSDSSSNGQPMLLSTTPDGTHGGGSPYTTNVAYQVNNAFVDQASYIASFASFPFGKTLILTVTAETPTLYYYSTNTSGMGGTITKS